jgi:hypothetical protein
MNPSFDRYARGSRVNKTPGRLSEERQSATQELHDAAVKYAQAALDALHTEDLKGHIPTVRTALAAAKAVGSVRDHLLLSKLGIYLHALTAISQGDRRAMVERLEQDADFSQNVGAYLIELLDHTEGQRKPAMVGAVFTAYAFQQIDSRTLQRLNAAIQHLPVTEVGSVRTLDSFDRAESAAAGRASPPDKYGVLALANAGLAEPNLAGGKISYSVSELGLKFLELELDRVRPTMP